MSRRTERLGSTIRDELAEIILHELDDPRLQGLPSITRVEVSEDLSVANVFVTIMGTPGQQTAALNALRHSAGMMRSKLTRAMSIRQTPFLKFKLDDRLRKEIEMLELLYRISRETAEADARRAESEPGTDASESTQEINKDTE
jgi:ribosome-binding factor A